MEANKIFEEATVEEFDIPEECEVVGHEDWETDGEDRLIKKFYWGEQIDYDGASRIGSFIVEFEPNSDKIIEFHSNIY